MAVVGFSLCVWENNRWYRLWSSTIYPAFTRSLLQNKGKCTAIEKLHDGKKLRPMPSAWLSPEQDRIIPL